MKIYPVKMKLISLNHLAILTPLLYFFFTTSHLDAKQSNVSSTKYQNTLDKIIKKKYLKVLTSRSIFDFFVYQGKEKGKQFELVKNFVKYLNNKYCKNDKIKIQFEMIPTDYDKLIPDLLDGKGDLVASMLSQTESRKKLISFSYPLTKTKEVLVTHKENLVQPLHKKILHLRKSSSYFSSFKKHQKNNDFKIANFSLELLPENLSTYYILEMIQLRKINWTLVDENIFDFAKSHMKDLVLFPMNMGQTRDLSWGLRPESKALLKEVNNFIPTVKEGSYLGNVLSQKYYEDMSESKVHKRYQRLSPFDDLLKKYAQKYHFDWRLLASLAFQESRFNQKIQNKWGAIGAFQVKAQTAKEPYVDIYPIEGQKNLENNIHAGTKYLRWIADRYFKDLDQKNQIHFSLAAYNAGPARVLRAQKLAKKLKLNPKRWFRNVEIAMIKLKKMEPVLYVSQVKRRFDSYSFLMPQ